MMNVQISEEGTINETPVKKNFVNWFKSNKEVIKDTTKDIAKGIATGMAITAVLVTASVILEGAINPDTESDDE